MATAVPPPPLRTGTISHFAGLLRNVMQYLSARLALAGLEAKEAGAHYGVAAVLIAGGIFVAVLGYVFLVTTAVFGIAAACGGKHAWIWAMAGAAILHLGGAAALIFLGYRRMRTGAFSSTREEFNKDKAWLNHLANKR